ncbi:MAG: phosphoglycerate kinase, partial [Pirellulales bacterium]|nr:phosphoglycerate kinase [Pirellulales bacterium]
QRLGNATIPVRVQVEPFGKIDPERRLIGHRRAVVLHDGLGPFTRIVVPPIEPFDDEPVLLPGIARQHVTAIEGTAHTTAAADLGDAVTGQRCRVGQIFLAEFDQPCVGNQRIGSYFVDRFPADMRGHDKLDFDGRAVGKLTTTSADAIGPGDIGVDIGEKSIALFKENLAGAKTVVWNGLMGIFEIKDTAKGAIAVAQALAEITAKGAITVVGGGDSVSAVEKNGLADKVTHVSTGGGASLEFLEGKVLPGVAALSDK